MNIAEIEFSLRELVDLPFNPSEFPFAFLAAYDAPKATVTKLKQASPANLLGHVEVHLRRKLFFRSTDAGQAGATMEAIAAQFEGKKDAPQFLMATDGAELLAKDLKAGTVLDIEYGKLNDSFDYFLPLAGIERYEGIAESEADIKATSRLAKLYDAILESNADWRDPTRAHSLNLFMTRLLFCFFAEGTSIFDAGQFTQAAMTYSREDGSDFAATLGLIFRALAVDRDERGDLPDFAKRFPYVNGGLFREEAPIPVFSRRARRLLKGCGELKWSAINPDIFGSMIQAIVEPGMRGDMGMHYTSVPNIMKALQPLFLLSLEEDFDASRDSEAKLTKLLVRLTRIRVFDPACGSGNFLIIAYRELRKLEARIFARLRELGSSAIPMTGIHLHQFFGIELADFAAETAKLSLWIAEYQMNEQVKEQFGIAPAALPLRDSGNIVHENALRIDWLDVCPARDGAETYVVGNPPYLGSTNQDAEQKADMDRVFSSRTRSYKNLDYVAAWYVKAADYAQLVPSQSAFVATNSICQGEQVAMLWPLIYRAGMEIGFAHQAFKWRNNASQVAGVTCVIVGIRQRSNAKKVLYSAELARVVRNISPYLIEMDDTIVTKEAKPINGLPKMDWGNKATDDGNFILTPEEKQALLAQYPEASKFVRRYAGAQEFIKGIERHCIWVLDEEAEEAVSIPPIKRRIDAVAAFRLASKAPSTREFAEFPHRFRQIQGFGVDAVIVPRVFSEDRHYITAGFISGADSIVNDNAMAVYGGEPYVLALISSRLHIMWISTVCGGLETRIRYSNTMGFHTFPVPSLSDEQKQELEDHAWAVISAREGYPTKTIGELYDPEAMPVDLLRAHRDLDATLERICIGRLFRNDTERLEYLFKQYVSLKRKNRPGAHRRPSTRELDD
ncbi:class I SAM-dependent DNA methyltransferase [Comamonas aquatica]|uniref:class I SAM-dependent DNA methyltransferase n=1 Tax=Comamonas aquatica TaxID=225991 RepID=UPI003D01D231